MVTNMIKIYGKNCIYAAIRAKSPIKKLFLLDTIFKKDKNIIDIANKNYNYEIVSKTFMDKEFGASHQGYGAYRENYSAFNDNDLDLFKNNKRILALDGIEDPHNLGAILRSVDAFGYDLVILPKNRSVSINETVAHVSTGAIEYTRIMYTNSLYKTIESLKKMDYWICGTDAKGDSLLSQIDQDRKLCVIIGSEGFGMSKTLVKACDYLITIPMVGHVNSLNASVSTAIVLQALINDGKEI